MPEAESSIAAQFEQRAKNVAHSLSAEAEKVALKSRNFENQPKEKIQRLAEDIARDTFSKKREVARMLDAYERSLREHAKTNLAERPYEKAHYDALVAEKIETAKTAILTTIEQTRTKVTKILVEGFTQVQELIKAKTETRTRLDQLRTDLEKVLTEASKKDFDLLYGKSREFVNALEKELPKQGDEKMQLYLETTDGNIFAKPDATVIAERKYDAEQSGRNILNFSKVGGNLSNADLRFLNDFLRTDHKSELEKITTDIAATTDPDQKKALELQRDMLNGFISAAKAAFSIMQKDAWLSQRFALINKDAPTFAVSGLIRTPTKEQVANFEGKKEILNEAIQAKKEGKTGELLQEKWGSEFAAVQKELFDGTIRTTTVQANEIITLWKTLESPNGLNALDKKKVHLSKETLIFLHDYLEGAHSLITEEGNLISRMERNDKSPDGLKGRQWRLFVNTVIMQGAKRVRDAILDPRENALDKTGDLYRQLNEGRTDNWNKKNKVQLVDLDKGSERPGMLARLVNKRGGIVNTLLFVVSKLWLAATFGANFIVAAQSKFENQAALTHAAWSGGLLYGLKTQEHRLHPGRDVVSQWIEIYTDKKVRLQDLTSPTIPQGGLEKGMLRCLDFSRRFPKKPQGRKPKEVTDHQWRYDKELEYLKAVSDSDVVNGSENKRVFAGYIEEMEKAGPESDFFRKDHLDRRHEVWGDLKTARFNEHEVRNLLTYIE